MAPNIICISIDSLRADFVSFLGGIEETTPELSSLTNESTVYQSAITPSVWTLPVHTSVFTGLFPPGHGIETGEELLGDHQTFAELLADEGYSTRAFYDNAWLDTSDILRGFQDRSDDSSTPRPAPIKSRISDVLNSISPVIGAQASSAYQAVELYSEWRKKSRKSGQAKTDGQQKISTAISSLDDVESPFCWFLHFDEAHWPYKPPNPYHRMFTDRNTADLVKNYVYWQEKVYGTRQGRLETISGDIKVPDKEVETFKNLYRGSIAYCDQLIGLLVENLKQKQVWDETILIVFGDHGDSFGEQGVFGHHFSTDDSLVRVPLLIRDPTGRLTQGQVSSPVSLVDIYPTILGLVGIDPPENDGIDLAEGVRDYAYTYYDVSGHDYYDQAPEHGISHSQLPEPVQHVIWQSPDNRLTQFPQIGEYNTTSDDPQTLQAQLETHHQDLIRINSNEGRLTSDVEERLVNMGYKA